VPAQQVSISINFPMKKSFVRKKWNFGPREYMEGLTLLNLNRLAFLTERSLTHLPESITLVKEKICLIPKFFRVWDINVGRLDKRRYFLLNLVAL
jgi:hypothetical protein